MNITEEQYELAERYLADLLQGKELTEFEKMMEDNPALKEEVEKIRKVNELVFMEGLKMELPTIQKAQQQYLFRQQLKYYGKWMGGFIILIGAVTIVWPFVGKNEGQNTTTIVEKKSAVNDSMVSTLKPVTKESERSFSSNPSPVITNQEDSQNLSPLEETKKDMIQEKNIPLVNLQKDTLKEKTLPKTLVDPCKDQISGSFEAVATCENKSEGSIRLKSVSGGDKPYLLSLDNGQYRETTVFQFLSDGDYQIMIKDAKGCSSKLHTVKVPIKPCAATSRDYVFSYQNTPEFIFPELSDRDFSFEVFNSAGGMEYSVRVTNGVPSTWSGYGSNGQKLSIGSYGFRITNSENKVLQQGTITIVD